MQQTHLTNNLKIFTSGKIGDLVLRNRIIRSGCFEGMSPNANPSDELIEHHRGVAAGGTAMTTFHIAPYLKMVLLSGMRYGCALKFSPD
jgi:2,4-dienoyl-CoA reductase-like NADH-dependent reductase (Old Yellow Enzyme family)